MVRLANHWILFSLTVALATAFVPTPILSRCSSSASADSSYTLQLSASSSFLDYLKFAGEPTFDVIAKTKEYVKAGTVDETRYATDYVLRGAVIGPITRPTLAATQGGFDLLKAYPNLERQTFGFTVDPENPYRCFYMQRWKGVHVGTLVAAGIEYPATGNIVETPVFTNSVHWNPQGKIVYEAVGNVVDRHEGTTEGKAAVFGLLHGAGLKIPANVGSSILRAIQRLGHLDPKNGRSWSKPEDIPAWWKSRGRGADPTDPYP
jgi:hypothetical protein